MEGLGVTLIKALIVFKWIPRQKVDKTLEKIKQILIKAKLNMAHFYRSLWTKQAKWFANAKWMRFKNSKTMQKVVLGKC